MPNILQSLIPSFGGKTVLVTNQAGTEVFSRAQILKAEVKPESKPMEHPVETGAIITDHRILLPIEIELSMVLSSDDYKDVYKEIASNYSNGTLLTVQCRAGLFTNQLIQGIPHTEDAEQYNAIVLALKLKQVRIVTAPNVRTSTVTPSAGTTAPTVAPANAPTVVAPASDTNAVPVVKGQQNALAVPFGRSAADRRTMLSSWNAMNPKQVLAVRPIQVP